MSSTPAPIIKDKSQKPEIPLSTFAFLFCEIVQYHRQHCTDMDDLERKLHQAGLDVGKRVLELTAFRQGSKNTRREINNPVSSLHYIYSSLWKQLFGRNATGLVRGGNGDDGDCELYLIEAEPITNLFVSVPKTYGDVNCAAFLAGIINGAMIAMAIDCSVHAGWDETHAQTVFVINLPKSAPK